MSRTSTNQPTNQLTNQPTIQPIMKKKGIETHWYTPQSQNLAQKIQNSLISATLNTDRGTVNSMFYVIHHTNIPSVLVEIGFISNDIERTDLLTEDKQNLIAKAISDGILQYLKSL